MKVSRWSCVLGASLDLTGLIARSAVVEPVVKSFESPRPHLMTLSSFERAHASPLVHTPTSSIYPTAARSLAQKPACSIYLRVARLVTPSPVSSICPRIAKSMTPSPPMLPLLVCSPLVGLLTPTRHWYAHPDWAALVRNNDT